MYYRHYYHNNFNVFSQFSVQLLTMDKHKIYNHVILAIY